MMMIKNFKLYFICFFAATLFFAACSKTNKPNLQGNVYPVGAGFGYKIVVNGKPYINQQYIPAIQGQTRFCDSTDAKKVCHKVMEKLAEGKMPFITVEELKELKIKTKC